MTLKIYTQLFNEEMTAVFKAGGEMDRRADGQRKNPGCYKKVHCHERFF